MSDLLQVFLEFFQSETQKLFLQMFVVITITILASYVAGRLLVKIHDKAQKTSTIWDDSFVSALRQPLKMLIMLIGISFSLQIADKEVDLSILSAVSPLRDVLIVVILSLFILRFISNLEKGYIENQSNSGVDLNTVNAIVRLVRASVYISATLILMQSFGINISGVLAFGGVSGVAMGFAAKDLLANFFGFIMIYLDKPFKVGDWIRSPDRDIEGTVEMIGWRQTMIRTFDQRPRYVPNSLFSSIIVENPSRMTNRRIYENIGVRYDDINKIPEIVSEIKEYLEASDLIAQNQTTIVSLNEFADSSVNIMVYCFTKTTVWVEFHEQKEKILLDFSRIISEKGAEIAFPTTTLEIAKPVIVSKSLL